jgi:hypothetical protein
MIDRGIVKEVEGDTARVEVKPHGGCPSCGNRGVCGGGRAGAFVMQAENRAGARPGDRVLLGGAGRRRGRHRALPARLQPRGRAE